jgi:hypothetical protein
MQIVLRLSQPHNCTIYNPEEVLLYIEHCLVIILLLLQVAQFLCGIAERPIEGGYPTK